MAYVTEDEVYAAMPERLVTEALDDDGTGEAQAGLLDQVIANAQTAIDGLIGTAVVLPLSDPIPAAVRRAALVFVLEMVNQRRQVPVEQNPWKNEADRWRGWLERVGKGEASIEAVSEVLAANYGGGTRVKLRGEA